MRTQGGPRPGMGALGPWLGLALLAGGLAGACGGMPNPARSASPSPPPSPWATPPEDLCAHVVGYWSRKVLDDDTYGDYQSMGLSNGQYEILRKVVDDARAMKKRQGAKAADALIDRRAREGCADWYRGGGPGKGPWS
ncbi:hypothetical protein [Streptomyces sp. NPDC046197]|uniref:hypothetical protein n=1 Tax=Streptomyces sp. NPDC046197 TaxID=3154337 RepID=UPI0033CED7C5